MLRKQVKVGKPQRIGKARGLGLAVFLLVSLTSVRAQQPTAPSALPPVAASKETSTPIAPSDARSTPSNDYVVSPQDLLDVNVFDVPEVSRTYRVSANGFLSLPLLSEPILAAGETLDQLSHLIASKFHDAGMLNNAHVTVSIVETRLHTVLVTGEVRNPEALPIFGPTRLLDVLVRAGGLTNLAGNDAIIMRADGSAGADLAERASSVSVTSPAKEQAFTLNIRKLMETGDEATNVLLYPGDRVTILRAQLIYILGAVARPGGYVLDEGRQHITVLKALALAGDVNNVAKRSRITILRRDPAGPEEKRMEIPVNYKGMVKGQVADVRLNADDILFVPESTRLKTWRTSVNSVVSMATYGGDALVVYH